MLRFKNICGGCFFTMFQLFGAARTLNNYGATTAIYEEKTHRAIENLKLFKERNGINYLDADDENYPTELQLIQKLQRIEAKKTRSSQSASLGLTNNVLRSILPGPVGHVCDVVSTATRAIMQSDNIAGQPAVGVAIQAVAEREVQRACLRGVTTAAAELAGTAISTIALPTALTAGVVAGTVAVIASEDLRSAAWTGLQNTVNGSVALGRDWMSRVWTSETCTERLINSHNAIDRTRRGLFAKRADLATTSILRTRNEAELQNCYALQRDVQTTISTRQQRWYSWFVHLIGTSDNFFLCFLSAVFCYLSRAFKIEKDWYVHAYGRVNALNAAAGQASSSLTHLRFRASKLSQSISNKTSRISTLAQQYHSVLTQSS
jgi:hypothetical protein